VAVDMEQRHADTRAAALGRWQRRLVGIFVLGLLVPFGWALAATHHLGASVEGFDELLRRETDTMLAVERLNAVSERMARASRSYLLTGDNEFQADLEAARAARDQLLGALEARLAESPSHELVLALRSAGEVHDVAHADLKRLREISNDPARLRAAFEARLLPARRGFDAVMASLVAHERHAFAAARTELLAEVATRRRSVGVTAVAAAVSAIVLAWSLWSTIRRLRDSQRREREALMEMARANDDLDAFAGRVAHDLRNALNPLRLQLGVLRRRLDDPPRALELVDRLERGLERTGATLDGLLAFTRAAVSHFPPASTSLPRAVDAALESLEPKRVESEAEIEIDLPQVRLSMDESLLHVVLVNVVGNALKFVAGRVTRRVHISATAAAGVCRLCIADTGSGIPNDSLARIFEPFFRAPGVTAPGTGIGLAMVRRLVEAHGGTVAVESQPGAGTCVTLVLPVVAAPDTATGPEVGASSHPAGPS
jgi:signal transduction histidine kinase